MEWTNGKIISVMYIISPFVFLILWLLSAVTDGSWTFGEQSLSTLGISGNALSAALFNIGCILMGGMIAVSGYLIHRVKDTKAIPIILAADGIFLLCVGIFTKAEATYPIHCFVATTFGVIAALLIIHCIGVHILRGQYIVSVILGILAVIAVFFTVGSEFPLAEAIDVIVAMCWFEIMGLEMYVSAKKGGPEDFIPL